MIRSMTGYGRSESAHGALRLTVEMRAVNHRYGEISIRLPKAWGMLEDPVRKVVASAVRRGRVEVAISFEQGDIQAAGMQLDWAMADQYMLAVRQIQSRYALTDSFSAKDLLTMPGVLQSVDRMAEGVEDLEEWVTQVVHNAAADLLTMKIREGEKLHQDLTERLASIVAWTEEIRDLVPQSTMDYRQRLQQRLAHVKEATSLELDEQRLAQEIVLFADRSDITEEITRLLSHCTQFSEQLMREEAVGRKLDFLLQEMNRETNTIAAKTNYLPISRLAVDMKTELEKLREQVQNIE